MQLEPFEYFTVVRQIDDPLDVGTTYYPQAEIRNAQTDALLATLDLDSKGDGRYSKRWQVPADVSGLGFYITIITKTYTDSDHTTESSNYGRKEQTFLVKERVRSLGGNSGLTGRDVEAILRKVLGLGEKDIFTVENEPVDLGDVVEALKSIPGLTADRVIEALPEEKEETEPEPFDYQPIFDALTNGNKEILDAISELDIPDYSNQFTVLLDLTKRIKGNLDKANIDEALKLIPELNKEIQKLPQMLTAIEQAGGTMKDNFMMLSQLFGMSNKTPDTHNKEVRRLMRS